MHNWKCNNLGGRIDDAAALLAADVEPQFSQFEAVLIFIGANALEARNHRRAESPDQISDKINSLIAYIKWKHAHVKIGVIGLANRAETELSPNLSANVTAINTRLFDSSKCTFQMFFFR